MKLNLYEIIYNNKQWEIQQNSAKCIIKNLETSIAYDFFGDIVGICQISDTDFLINRRMKKDKFNIVRYSFCNPAAAQTLFTKDFHRAYVLSDHTILFDNNYVYDITTDDVVEEFSWLRNKKFDVISNESYPNVFFELEVELGVSYPTEFIYAYVDATTFKIISNQVYSTLRGGIVKLSDELSFSQVVDEDQKYISIIKSLFFSTYMEAEKQLIEFYSQTFQV